MKATTPVGGTQVQSASAAPQALTITFDPASGSYTLAANGSETFSPSELSASSTTGKSTYDKSNGDELALLTASPSSHKTFSYAGIGVWKTSSTSGGSQTTNYSTFDYGPPTPSPAVPRIGSSAYDVDLVGYLAVPGQTTKSLSGPGLFEVDFLSGSFRVLLSPVEQDLATGKRVPGSGFQLTAGGDLSSSDATFAGQAVYNDNGTNYVGALAGRFYGPAGQELGASFSASNPNGGAAAGSFVGTQDNKGPSANLGLPDLLFTQTFDNTPGEDLIPTITSTGAVKSFGYFPTSSTVTLHPGGVIDFVPGFNSYYLQTASFGPGDTVTPSQDNFTSYRKTVNGYPLGLDLYNVGRGNTELALTYMDFGVWSQSTPLDDTQTWVDHLFFVYGQQTPAPVLAGMTGTAQYTGVAYGYADSLTYGGQFDVKGPSTFNVDFSSMNFTGSMTLNGAGRNGVANVNFGDFTFGGAVGAGVQVPVSQAGTNVGKLTTYFYGPAAEEVGGPFTITMGATTIQGAAAAKRH